MVRSSVFVVIIMVVFFLIHHPYHSIHLIFVIIFPMNGLIDHPQFLIVIISGKPIIFVTIWSTRLRHINNINQSNRTLKYLALQIFNSFLSRKQSLQATSPTYLAFNFHSRFTVVSLVRPTGDTVAVGEAPKHRTRTSSSFFPLIATRAPLHLVWYIVVVAAPRALAAMLEDATLLPPLFPSLGISSPLSSLCRLSHLNFRGSQGKSSSHETVSSSITIHHRPRRRLVGTQLHHRVHRLGVSAQSTNQHLLLYSTEVSEIKRQKSTAIPTHVTSINFQSAGGGSSSSPKVYDTRYPKKKTKMNYRNWVNIYKVSR